MAAKRKKKSAAKASSKSKKKSTKTSYKTPPKRVKDPKRVKAGKKARRTLERNRRESAAKSIQKRAKDAGDERFSTMSKEELIAYVKEVEEKARILEMMKTWVPYHDAEYLHTGRRGHQAYPGGSIAVQPSRARLLPASQLSAIMRRLRHADREGELDSEVRIIADEIDLPIREVYTLWFSP